MKRAILAIAAAVCTAEENGNLSGLVDTSKKVVAADQVVQQTPATALRAAQGQVATLQGGFPGSIAGMAPVDAWDTVLPAPSLLFRANGPRWSVTSYSPGTTSADRYLSVKYVFCGFC